MAKFEVKESFYIDGRGLVVVGKLKEGILKKGMHTKINEREVSVISIESNGQKDEIFAEIDAGVLLQGMQKEDIKNSEINFY